MCPASHATSQITSEGHDHADVLSHGDSIGEEPSGGGALPTCVRCKDSITTGHAYELGDDRWHTRCFACYRCEKPLSCDSDFLVLGTGTLICFDCSDSCKSCGKKIGDLAIILSSSNEAYCSECFKCCKCGEKIKDLRYAKTKRGLFCIHCHEKLLIKRKHYEEKKRRLKKTLPEIPPPPSLDELKHSLESSDALVIPEKSSRRPLSPLRNHQRTTSSGSFDNSHVKANSDSIISQYLDGNGSTEGLEDSGSSSVHNNDLASSRTAESGIKHERNVSIDDILDSTLANDDNVDDVHLSVKGQDAARTLLNKTPLRNHRHNNSFSKSPMGNRRGMILDGNDSEGDLQKSIEDDFFKSEKTEMNHPSTIAINTPTAIQYESPKKSADESFNKQKERFSDVNGSSAKEEAQSSDLKQRSKSSASTAAAASYPLQEKRQGLALNFLSANPQADLLGKEEDTLTLGIDSQTLTTITSTPTIQPSNKLEDPVNSELPIKAHNGVKGLTDTNPGIINSSSPTKSPSGGNLGMYTQNGHSNSSRSIGRSFSLKSRNLVNNIRSKTSGILDPKPSSTLRPAAQNPLNATVSSSGALSPKLDSSDTHSGWGVSSSEKSTRRKSPSITPRNFSRGQSDGMVQAERKNTSIDSSIDGISHQRTNSNASGSSAINVSMYRTPPLESSAAFNRKSHSDSRSHLRNSSWQTTLLSPRKEIIDDPSKSDIDQENEHFIESELAAAELKLRKLKLELGELESKRSQLMNEVDALQTAKSVLTGEIDNLRSEKENFLSIESLDHSDRASDTAESQKMKDSYSDNTSPVKQLDTASIARPAAKPRFWKIFSGGKQQNGSAQGQPQQIQQQLSQGSNVGNNSSHSATSSELNSNNRIEISAPVLQNPNEFSDMKLMPIQNKSSSSTSSQASPTKQEGSYLYGSSLVARCAYEQSAIPRIVRECTNHIERNEDNLKAEGIYRKSGSQLLIEEIEREFVACDVGSSPELERLLNEDVHAVASVLKRYLRKLPNPVLSFQIYEPLMNIVRDNRLMVNLPLKSCLSAGQGNLYYKTAIDSVSKTLSYLPAEHYELLKFLVLHINKVTTYSEFNLMNLFNLSLVFAPGLIRDYSGDKDITDMKERNYIVGFIVGNYKELLLNN